MCLRSHRWDVAEQDSNLCSHCSVAATPGTFLEGGLSPEDDGGVLEGSGSLGGARTLEWSQTGTMGSQRWWWPRVGVSRSQGLRG